MAFRCILMCFATLTASLPALAQSTEVDNCMTRLAEPEAQIDACSAVIDAGEADSVVIAQAHQIRGNAHMAAGDFSQAIHDFDIVLSLYPGTPNALYGRGSANLQLDRLDQAIADFDRAIALDPALMPAQVERAVAHSMLGLYEPALGDLDRVLSRAPDADAARGVRVMVHGRLGQVDAAIADLEVLSHRQPGWIADLQRELADAGTYVGPVDGRLGHRTRVALRQAIDSDLWPTWP